MGKVVLAQVSLKTCLSAFPREGISPSTIFSSLFINQQSYQTNPVFTVRNTPGPLYALFSMAIQGLKGSHDL